MKEILSCLLDEKGRIHVRMRSDVKVVTFVKAAASIILALENESTATFTDIMADIVMMKENFGSIERVELKNEH